MSLSSQLGKIIALKSVVKKLILALKLKLKLHFGEYDGVRKLQV